MPSNSTHHVSAAAAAAGPSARYRCTPVVSGCYATASSTLEIPKTTFPSPTSVSLQQLPRQILLPPKHGQFVACSSVLPRNGSDGSDGSNNPSVAQQQQQQSRSVIRKAGVLANWTSSTGRSFATSGTVTRSSPMCSTRPILSTLLDSLDSTIPNLHHSTSTQTEPPRLSSESRSRHAHSDRTRSSTPQSSLTSNTYFPLHLSTSNAFQAFFKGPDGRTLYSTSTKGRTTVIRRLYGRSARTTRQKEDGLILAEIEWMDRVKSSRIRFKGGDVDVRIDEYLKETRGGNGQSRMFATSDGRTYKWKAGCPGGSAELFECASGKRVSGLLASSNPSMSSTSSLPTPPPTPPVILSPTPSTTVRSATPSSRPSPAMAKGFEVPSISLSEPETRQEGEKPTLRVHTSVMNLVDQIIVTWVIMERDRTMFKRE